MDYEKMWYELKQYLIEINELDIFNKIIKRCVWKVNQESNGEMY